MVVKKANAVIAAVAVAVVFYLLGAFVGLPKADKNIASGDVSVAAGEDGDEFAYLHDNTLKEAIVSGRVPKKLKNFNPFWGVPTPESGESEQFTVDTDCIYYRAKADAFPAWVTWNLDLASPAPERYKFDRYVVGREPLECRSKLCEAVDECYRWAWRKPYGNTNLVMGPVFNPKNESGKPDAFFVAVCKRERLDVPMPLGFTSMAYMIPVADSDKKLSEYALSVNAMEAHCGYDLFGKLPASVQDMVEEITQFELLFQEIGKDDLDMLEPDMAQQDWTDDPVHDR